MRKRSEARSGPKVWRASAIVFLVTIVKVSSHSLRMSRDTAKIMDFCSRSVSDGKNRKAHAVVDL